MKRFPLVGTVNRSSSWWGTVGADAARGRLVVGRDAAQATIVIIVVVIVLAVALGSVRPTMEETGPALVNSDDETRTSVPVGPDGARVRGGSLVSSPSSSSSRTSCSFDKVMR